MLKYEIRTVKPLFSPPVFFLFPNIFLTFAEVVQDLLPYASSVSKTVTIPQNEEPTHTPCQPAARPGSAGTDRRETALVALVSQPRSGAQWRGISSGSAPNKYLTYILSLILGATTSR